MSDESPPRYARRESSSTAPRSRSASDAAPSRNPGDGRLVGARDRAPARTTSTARCAPRTRRSCEWRTLGYADARARSSRAARRGAATRTSTSSSRCSSPSRARRCARRKLELHKAAETLEHYAGLAKEVRGRLRARARPRRRRPRPAQAARRRGGDRPVELPDDAAAQQARPGARRRQHGRRQAGRHDAVHDAAPRRDPHRGRPAARRAQRRHRAPARRRARRSSRTR